MTAKAAGGVEMGVETWREFAFENPDAHKLCCDAIEIMRRMGWAVTVFSRAELREAGLTPREAEERMVRYVNT